LRLKGGVAGEGLYTHYSVGNVNRDIDVFRVRMHSRTAIRFL
jgi:hypothetical protein